MDPATGVVTFLTISAQVIRLCDDYIQSIKDAQHTVRNIRLEVSSVTCVVENLRDTPNFDSPSVSEPVRKLWCEGGTMDSCLRAMLQLESLLADQTTKRPTADSQKKGKTREALAQIVEVGSRVIAAARWPFREKEAKKLLKEIAEHKQTINLALSVDSSFDMKKLRAGVDLLVKKSMDLAKESMDQVKESMEGYQRQEICNWLEVKNPSDRHNKAFERHQEGTGLWVLELEQWRDWVARTTRCVWINGIPGAGKTIMASFLFNTIKEITGSSKNATSIYYYCYFGNDQDETNSLLGWIVSRLCRSAREMPDNLRSIHETGIRPTDAELLEGLANILDSFTSVYVVIDALDESKEPFTKLLMTLKKIATEPRFNKIQLLVTSRDLSGIRWALSDVSASVAMQLDKVEGDIRKYVTNLLRGNDQFSRWPEKLRCDVEERLPVGAEGMFRWVDCQIDILGRLRSIKAVEEALSSLPKGLDATYHRIFEMIPEHERTYVKRALSFLCAHNKFTPIPGLPMLQSALLPLVTENWERENSQSSGSDLYDLTTLEEACGCLVTFDKSEWGVGVAYLAHFSVREFLLSERHNTNPNAISRLFALSEDIVDRTFLEATLAVVLEYTGPEDGDVYDYAFIGAVLSIEHRLKDLRSWKLDSLVLRMVSPQGQHSVRVVKQFCRDEEVREKLTRVYHALK
ncbi:hypothetical protein BKA56DRAFT_677755 [Ilyonectria sp. MPI-CAGE-AT-0026]|nr:hypothetical protein BKA56DRAFT_677755 [Ilyonectria sp. MPI-CAGE-AT-0026]